MSMKNDLINHINTKVSAPDMEYSDLIRSGSATLDEAFKPYKNTEQIISANNHLNALATLKNFELGKLAVEEQNEKFRQQTSEYFENSKKINNELGANLFTNNGFNLNGTEESWKADKIKYFEQYTGMENVSIYDIINNLDDPKLNLPVAYKEEMRKYAEYNYNKNKIDNMILDDGDINNLANENYDKDALFGQNFETFKLGYKQNSNRLDDVISGKANQLVFNSIHNHRFFEAERIKKQEEEDKKRLNNMAEGQNSNNQQQNVTKNVTKNVSNNPEDNFQNISNNVNKAQQIQNKINIDNLSKENLDNDKDLEKMVEILYEDPTTQVKFSDQLLSINGIKWDDLYEESMYDTWKRSGINLMDPVTQEMMRDKSFYEKREAYDLKFIEDMFANAKDGRILKTNLSGFDRDRLSKGSQKIYDTLSKMVEMKNLEYIKVTDNTKSIVNNSKYRNEYNTQPVEENREFKDLGVKALNQSEYENAIKNTKIFKDKNRKYHNNDQDIELSHSNNIIVDQYDGTSQTLRPTVYYLITSDKVLDIRFELMRLYQNNPEGYSKMLKDKKLRNKYLKDLKVAMSNAMDDVDLPNGSISPDYNDISMMTLITDCMTLPNKDYLRANPIALGAVADKINKTASKYTIANLYKNTNNK